MKKIEKIESVTLSDGSVVKRRAAKVRDLANAERAARGDQVLAKYGYMAVMLERNRKIMVLEEILDLDVSEMEKISTLFEDDEKNVKS